MGNGNLLQYSCLENSMDRGVWWATLLGVAKSRTWLSTHYIFSISISNAILLCYHWNDLTFFFFWRDLVFIQSGMRASQMELAVKNLPADAGDIRDASSIPGSWRSPGRGHGNPFQYSCLENPMDRRAWWPTVHRSHRVGHDWSNLATAHKGLWKPTTDRCQAECELG